MNPRTQNHAELLTPEEIETLVGSRAPMTSNAKADASEARWLQPPKRIALENMLREFSANLGRACSEMLRTLVEVSVSRIDEQTFGQYAASVDNPTCLCVLNEPAQSKFCFLEIPLDVVFPLVDRMLGGGQVPTVVLRRPLTEIEVHLMRRVAALAVRELNRAASPACALQLEVVDIDSDMPDHGVLLPNEPVAAVHFEIALGNVHGTISLCISADAANRLTDDGPPQGAWTDAVASEIRPSRVVEDQVRLTVHLPDSMITADEANAIQIGDIIATEHALDAPVAVCIDGEPKFDARLLLCNGRRAVRISGSHSAHDCAQ